MGKTNLKPLNAYLVTGHAFVPVQVQVEVLARTANEAMEMADRSFLIGTRSIAKHIVNGSEDEKSAHNFRAFSARLLEGNEQ